MKFYLTILVILFVSTKYWGQNNDPIIVGDTVDIYTMAGDTISGQVISINDNSLKIKKKNGQIIVYHVNEIQYLLHQGTKFVVTIGQESHTRLKRHTPQMSVFPTAYPIPKGQLQYENTMLFYNGFRYGITNKFSMGLHSFLPLIDDTSFNLVLDAKYTFMESSRVAMALGSHLLFVDDNGNNFININYIATTLGSPRHNFTIGPGYLLGSEGSTLGGIANFHIEMDDSWVLTGEATFSWIDSDYVSNSSVGIRYMSDSFVLDISALAIYLDGSLGWVPWAGLKYVF